MFFLNKGIVFLYFIFLKIKIYFELLKFRLSFLVSFSAIFGYFLSIRDDIYQWNNIFMFFLGGLLISGSAIIINQVLEIKYDSLMYRTKYRPLPTKRINIFESIFFSFFIFFLGLLFLFYYTNLLTVLLSVISFLIYAFIYTPLKRIGPISVFVGAFPGALPPLIGWSASTGEICYESLLIFIIQFFWQFPHFWSIAWVSHEDYIRAGFKLLPRSGKNLNTIVQIIIYTLLLIPCGLLPFKFGITGIKSAIIVTIFSFFFLIQVFFLIKNRSKKVALKIMFTSFLYLPIMQISYLLDKI